MNKGMIMEVKKSYAIALTDTGIMEKIKSKPNMEVGQKIFYFEDDIIKVTSNNIYRRNNFMKAFGSIAALFLLVFTFFNTFKYDQAYAVVSLDINPSIQIEADSNQKIIKVEGINDDGKKIDFNDVKNIPLEEGIQKIKAKLVADKYLEANKEVLVGVAFVKDGDSTSYEQELQAAIRSAFEDEVITYVKADKEEVAEAKTEGISLGRYKAKETAAVDEATKNKIGTAPVKEITALIKDKENVIQWEALDEKKSADVPVAEQKPETNTDKPEVDTNSGISNGNYGKNRQVINAPSENGDSNVDNNKDITPSKPKDNDILELDPEKPVQPDKEKDTDNPDDNSIIIEPGTGTIENKPTSGKIPEVPQTDNASSEIVNQVKVKPEQTITK